jgi:hypothetical protein
LRVANGRRKPPRADKSGIWQKSAPATSKTLFFGGIFRIFSPLLVHLQINHNKLLGLPNAP